MIITRSKKPKVENCLFLGKNTVNIEIIKAAKLCEGHLYSPLAHHDYTSINASYISMIYLSKPALIDSIAQIFSRCLCSKDVCAGLVACPYPCDSYDEEIRFRNEIFRGRNNTQIPVDSAKGHDCELLHVTGATGVYSSQRHRVPVPLHCHWQNVEASSVFKRGAINKRLMVKWKCLLW